MGTRDCTIVALEILLGDSWCQHNVEGSDVSVKLVFFELLGFAFSLWTGLSHAAALKRHSCAVDLLCARTAEAFGAGSSARKLTEERNVRG
jgi:hypothetical protein